MEKTVNIHAAKTHLSSLIAEAEAGEKITIARSGKPAVRLVPVKRMTKEKKKSEVLVDRKPGFLKGKIKIKKGFYDPLPADMLRSMLGEDD
jgi:prevent-host-death family protein